MAEQSETKKYGAESDAVRAHLSILQAVIQRMAGNSASCKTWCITLVAAMLVLVTRTETTNYVPLAFVPAVLFLFLDTYYLALERAFRGSYNAFVGKLHKGEVALSDLYVVHQGRIARQFAQSLRSFAILPFYIVLVILIVLVWKLA